VEDAGLVALVFGAHGVVVPVELRRYNHRQKSYHSQVNTQLAQVCTQAFKGTAIDPARNNGSSDGDCPRGDIAERNTPE
jgi:hypothetical protein